MVSLRRKRQRLVERFFDMNMTKTRLWHFWPAVLKMRIAQIAHGSYISMRFFCERWVWCMVDKLYHCELSRILDQLCASLWRRHFVSDCATPQIIKKLQSEGVAMHVCGISAYYAWTRNRWCWKSAVLLLPSLLLSDTDFQCTGRYLQLYLLPLVPRPGPGPAYFTRVLWAWYLLNC